VTRADSDYYLRKKRIRAKKAKKAKKAAVAGVNAQHSSAPTHTAPLNKRVDPPWPPPQEPARPPSPNSSLDSIFNSDGGADATSPSRGIGEDDDSALAVKDTRFKRKNCVLSSSPSPVGSSIIQQALPAAGPSKKSKNTVRVGVSNHCCLC